MTSVQISKWRETPSFPDPLVARKRLRPPLFPRFLAVLPATKGGHRCRARAKGSVSHPGRSRPLPASVSCSLFILTLNVSTVIFCFYTRSKHSNLLRNGAVKDPHRVSSHHDACLQTSGTRGWGLRLSVIFLFKPAILGVS